MPDKLSTDIVGLKELKEKVLELTVLLNAACSAWSKEDGSRPYSGTVAIMAVFELLLLQLKSAEAQAPGRFAAVARHTEVVYEQALDLLVLGSGAQAN